MEFEVLVKLYQVFIEILQGILKDNKVVCELEKLDKMGVVKVILVWLDEVEQIIDGNFIVLLLLNDFLIFRKIKVENILEKIQIVDIKLGVILIVEFKYKYLLLCIKDFKISGEILDRLIRFLFVSLVRQIEVGFCKFYSEVDIIDGVIRVIFLSLFLRSYFEGCENLLFLLLRKIFRFYYEEKFVIEFYMQLINLIQGRDEL